jgi:hypothetical protein
MLLPRELARNNRRVSIPSALTRKYAPVGPMGIRGPDLRSDVIE